MAQKTALSTICTPGRVQSFAAKTVALIAVLKARTATVQEEDRSATVLAKDRSATVIPVDRSATVLV